MEVEVAVEGGGEHKDIRSLSYGLYCLAAGFTGRGKRKRHSNRRCKSLEDMLANKTRLHISSIIYG